jgi:hypothetical protein
MDALSFGSKQRPDVGNGDTQVARLDDELEPSPESMVDLRRQQATPDQEPHRFLLARVICGGGGSRGVFHMTFGRGMTPLMTRSERPP